MPTVKVKRADGYHCFHCNAPVAGDAAQCPACGRSFTRAEGGPPPPLGRRTRAAFRSRTRGYRYAVIALAAIFVLLVLLFRPRSRSGPELPKPEGETPGYRLVEVQDQSTRGLERLSVVVVVDSSLDRAGLRGVLDRVLYETLDEHNRRDGRRVRVVWAYLLTDEAAKRSEWTAMAIWTDPSVEPARRPSGIGGDAVEDGPVEYDFTNNLAPMRGEPGEQEE